MKKSFFLPLIAFALLASCNKEQLSEVSTNSKTDVAILADSYDEKMYNLANAVSNAIRENQDFKSLIKQEVLKQFDGDYDVLLKDVVSLEIKMQAPTKSGETEITVRELLSGYLPSETKSLDDAGNYLDMLREKYPNTQISVPVHAEDWDPATYTPVVCFVPYDYEDLVTKYIEGIDADGNKVMVDAINEPDMPVIVISQNERVEMMSQLSSGWGNTGSGSGIGGGLGQITIDESKPTYPVFDITDKMLYRAVEIGLEVSYNNSRNLVEINVDNITNIEKYSIYRSTNYVDFTLVKKDIPATSTNVRYLDYDVAYNKEYQYYVIAYLKLNSGVYRKQSEIVGMITNMNVPKAVTNMEAVPQGNGNILITWDNPTQSNSKTYISKVIYDGVNENHELVVLTPTVTSYIDKDPNTIGQYVEYSIVKKDDYGRQSAESRCGIVVPYRNPMQTSRIFVKNITCDLSQVEGWVAGKPEFYIKVASVDKEGNITQGPKMSYKFDDRVSSNDCNIDVFQWQYKYDREYCQYVTIELFEYDDHIISWTDPLTLNLYLGLQLFDVIELKLGGTLTFNPQNNGVDCGQTTLGYHENPNTTLYFSRGCSLEISDK